jgi:hypothetical protein
MPMTLWCVVYLIEAGGGMFVRGGNGTVYV